MKREEKRMERVKEEWQGRHSSNNCNITISSRSRFNAGKGYLKTYRLVVLLYQSHLLHIILITHYRIYINSHEVVLYDIKLIITQLLSKIKIWLY